MTTNPRLAAIMAAAVLLGACADKGPTDVTTPPTDKTGTAIFAVASAPEFLGAIRFRMVGSGISNPTVRGSAKILGQRTVADTTTFLLSVTSGLGAFLQVSLADRTKIPSAIVQEATAGSQDGYKSIVPNTVVVTTTIP